MPRSLPASGRPRWTATAPSAVPAGVVLAVVIMTLLAPSRLHASEQKTSSSGSSNSSDSKSSNGSGDSSNSSKDSSNHSQASSKDSNNSTQNSPKSTSDYTSKGTSDWSTNSHGAHVFSIALAVVVVGASVVGTIGAARSQHDGQQRAAVALAAYMRQQHALLTHDVALASGPVLDAWTHDLRLTVQDRVRFRQALEGSSEQGALLEALDGPIDERRAQRFAAVFLSVTQRALGPARTDALIARATAAAAAVAAARDG